MEHPVIEMKANRALLNPEFDGYKLSLEEIPSVQKELAVPVDRILLDSNSYSLLHVKLFGLHNHLVGETVDSNDAVYYVNKNLELCKIYVDPFSFELVDPVVVWQIPKERQRQLGDYNVSFKFVNDKLAVLSNGFGIFYLLNTGSRNNDDTFNLICGEFVLEEENEEQGFKIVDAVIKEIDGVQYLHVLLLHIKQINDGTFLSAINWVTFNIKEEDTEATRQLQVKGEVQYASLDENCENILVIGEDSCKFTMNSECSVENKNYDGEQNNEKAIIKEDASAHDNIINNSNPQLAVSKMGPYDVDVTLIEHLERASIDPSELAQGIYNSEYVKGKLSRFAEEINVDVPNSNTFNTQETEECDIEYDKCITFERLNRKTNECLQKVNLGSHPVLLTCNINPDLPPCFGIQDDVDILLWQASENNGEFSLKHEGTLLALGYIQASKQQKKFFLCSPDLSYTVVCEATRYVLIYRQEKPVESGELRNRTTGKRIANTGQQQLINVSDKEILGVYASNRYLFLLGENFVKVFKM